VKQEKKHCVMSKLRRPRVFMSLQLMMIMMMMRGRRRRRKRGAS
jgi:hypothetical protein